MNSKSFFQTYNGFSNELVYKYHTLIHLSAYFSIKSKMLPSSLKYYGGDMIASGGDDGRLRTDSYAAVRKSVCFGADFPTKKV
jgi:hypothetical protein